MRISKKVTAWLMCLIMLISTLPTLAEAGTIYSDVAEGKPQELRPMLDIINEDAAGSTSIFVGDTLSLSVPEGYTDIVWASTKPDIATVDNGVVTALSEGSTRITASSDGQTKGIKITVLAKEPDKMTILIDGRTEQYVYDGTEHAVGYTASSSDAGFDAGKVRYVGAGKSAAVGTNIGYYRTQLAPEDFRYADEDVQAVFVVNDSWLKITPAQATITVGDVKKYSDEADPVPTVTIEGLIGDDTLAYEVDIAENGTEENGETHYDVTVTVPDPGNYKVEIVNGTLIVREHLMVAISGEEFEENGKTYVRMTAHPEGYVGSIDSLSYQWQIQEGDDFLDIEGANGQTYTFELSEETAQTVWRVVVTEADQ